MKKIVPGISTWSIFNTEKQLNFNGWYIEHQGEAVVIDPPTPGQAVLDEIEKRGRPKAILLTNKHHTRASEVFRRQFGCHIWIHEAEKKLMEIPIDRTFKHTDLFPCGLKAITLKNHKTEGETAFLFNGEVPALIVGDAVIGRPAGNLSMLPKEKFRDANQAKEALKILLEFKFEALLLGDGESFPSRGYEMLQQFLSK